MVLRLLLAFMLAQELVVAQHPNRIDSLHTVTQVVAFVRGINARYSRADPRPPYGSDTIPAFQKVIDSFHIQPFEKVDLDGNGFTDLVFNGDTHTMYNNNGPPLSAVILSFGKDSFLVKELSFHSFDRYFATRVLRFSDGPALQTLQTQWGEDGAEWKTDTLVWKLNTLIERTNPVKHYIERIDYTVSFSQLPGGNLALKITGDSARLTKELFTGLDRLDNGGVFLAKLDWATEFKLYSLLEQMDFTRLKDTYTVTYSDASSGFLDITYDNGKKKTIADRGLEGTYGLAELQNLLCNLQKTQYWVEATPLVTRNIDSIHTDAEVLGIVRALSNPRLDFAPEADVNCVQDFRLRAAAFGSQKWQKADFDGNGHTDLLFNGFQNEGGRSILSSLVVLSYPNDSLVVCSLSNGEAFFAAKAIHFGGKDYISTSLLHGVKDETQEKGYRLRRWEDTLVATIGQLKELPAKNPQSIQKLTKCRGGNFDKLEFTRDTIWWYKNIGMESMPIVDSHALYFTVDTAACTRLLDFADSIDLDRLDPSHERDDNDDGPFYTTWTFGKADGGQFKISSHDVTGSHSLQALDYLAETFIRTEVSWQLFRPMVDVICNCDRIDSLRTEEQVFSFIHGLNQSYYPAATYGPPGNQQRLDSFGAKHFQKLDLDNNGLTDLVFNGYDSLAKRRLSLLILAFDKDSFLIQQLPKEHYCNFFAAKAIYIDGNPFLQTQTEFYGKQNWDDSSHFQSRIDTLTWGSTGFIERSQARWHEIDTLRYLLSGGLGGIDLQLTIIGDSVTLEKSCDIKPETPIDSGGTFTAKMNFVTSEHLYSLLNATGFEKLNNANIQPVYDQSASDFEISYDNGKRKIIYDCGDFGPYGLKSLEDLLLGLPQKLHWKRLAPGGPDYYFVHDLYEYPF